MSKKDDIEYLLLLQEKRKRELEASFYEFVKDAFEVIHHDEELVDNWHIKYLCGVLQLEVERIVAGIPKTNDLIINVPPRSLKSFITTICLPVWMWLKKDTLKFIGASYSASLSIEHNMKSRRIVESEWFKERWPHIQLAKDQNTKSEFENSAGGNRRATSTGGAITGSGADIIAIDDPTNPKLARSEVERKNANVFHDETLSTRSNDPAVGLFIIIMQRLHEDDLTGHVLKKELIETEDGEFIEADTADEYQHICIPGELTKDVKPKSLEKYYVDGLMFPKRFTKAYLKKLKKRLGSFGYAGQILQSPSPDAGGIFKKDYWSRYHRLPQKFERIISSWDCTFKGLATSDFVACTVWGCVGPDRYLLHVFSKKMGFVDTISAMLRINQQFKVEKCVIEDKANGSAIIEVLKKRVQGIIPFEPGSRSKEERAYSVEPQLEAGNVYLPINAIATFDVDAFIDECAKFPNGEHDDIPDSVTMGLIYLRKHGANRLRAMGLFEA